MNSVAGDIYSRLPLLICYLSNRDFKGITTDLSDCHIGIDATHGHVFVALDVLDTKKDTDGNVVHIAFTNIPWSSQTHFFSSLFAEENYNRILHQTDLDGYWFEPWSKGVYKMCSTPHNEHALTISRLTSPHRQNCNVLIDLRCIYAYCRDVIILFLQRNIGDIVLSFLIPNIAYAEWNDTLPKEECKHWFSRQAIHIRGDLAITKRLFELPEFFDAFITHRGWEWLYAAPKSNSYLYKPLSVLLNNRFADMIEIEYWKQKKDDQLEITHTRLGCAKLLWPSYFACHRKQICHDLLSFYNEEVKSKNYDRLAKLGMWINQYVHEWEPPRLSLDEQMEWRNRSWDDVVQNSTSES